MQAQVQEVEGHTVEDPKQIQTSSTRLNHTRSVHMKCFICDWLIKYII